MIKIDLVQALTFYVSHMKYWGQLRCKQRQRKWNKLPREINHDDIYL